ncbi:MAG: succinylglutamate desuccinylase/aspartoacylase family protein [Oscillospiraceae bacterium]|nr:succinylglutamate desuccinylase/aspartoacylase family protein [Oscillospiraceae bacterium]
MFMKRKLSLLLAFLMLPCCLGGCGSAPDKTASGETVPADYQWATYYDAEDAPFLPKDIFSEALYVTGFVTGEAKCGYIERTERENTGAFVLKGEYGKCYEIKVPAGTQRVLAVKLPVDPAQTAVGNKLYYTEEALCDKDAVTEETAFMYTCRNQNEYLLICTNGSDPFYIGERTILQDTDIADQWWTPAEPVGSIGNDCTYGNFLWTADEVLENLYEPVRQRHPGYITREVIGKDQSGKYDMYAYIYTPENYETTMFLNGGTHGDEQTAYFALAKVMELIADAKPEDNLLYTLRHKVRFVVIPVLNVWSVSEKHIRANSVDQDLNRDFGNLTQQESKNLIAFLEKYADETRILMDFHIAAGSKVAVYFNFINFTDNAVANYKTTNHMYHRYMAQGYGSGITNISKVPGSYTKSDKYLEGRVWNSYGIPTITVEYVTTTNIGFPEASSSEAMTAAVETQMNFIIQNALYFLANP